jgi:hypothetical protein
MHVWHLFILTHLNQVSLLYQSRVMSMGHSTTSVASPVTSQGHMELPTCFSTSYQCVSPALVVHYVLMTPKLFLASFLSVIVYSLIFLTLRGTIAFNAGLKIHINPERRLRPRNETFEEYQRFVYSVARTMLWYVRPSLPYDPGLRPFCSGFRSVSSALRIIQHKHLNLLFSFHSCSSPFVHRGIDGYFWHHCGPWSYGIIVYIRAPRRCVR